MKPEKKARHAGSKRRAIIEEFRKDESVERAELARRFGVSKQYVSKILLLTGDAKRPPGQRKSRVTEDDRFYCALLCGTDASRAIGKSANWIRLRIPRERRKIGGRFSVRVRLRAIESLLRAGWSMPRIAAALSVPVRTCRATYYALGRVADF